MRALKILTFVSVLALGFPAYADTLNEALSKAYMTNPDLEAARAALRSVDEQAPQALSGYRPTVTASGSLARTSEDGEVTGEDDYTSRAAALQVEQPLFRGGRTVAAVRQADSSIAAQRASLLNTEQTVMLRGVEGYLNVVRDTAVLDLNKNNEEVLSRQLRATRDRFNVGEVTRTDVSQAEARLSAATSGRIQAEGALTSSRASYQRLFGDAPADLKKPDLSLALPKTLEQAIEEAKANNPSVQAAINTTSAAKALLDGIQAERLPTVSAEASLRRSYDAGGSNLDRVDTASAGVNLNWSLYQAGATSSRIREAKQEVARRSSERDSAERGAVEAATQAWENWQTSKSTVDSRRSQVKAARVALDGVREEANVGSRTVLDTLDAEQELLDAQVGLVRAEHDEILAQYQVLAAVGRLTARELQLPVEYYDETAYSDRVRNQWIGSSTGN
jgi:TolC family type I secretion outer membrane protein